MHELLTQDMAIPMAAAESPEPALIQSSVGLIAVLLMVLAAIFKAQTVPHIRTLFKFVPALVFCYFVPTLLTSMGVLPAESGVYAWIRAYVLPASLVLLTLSLDLPAIIRLGPKAVIMLLAGTAGIVIGGPIALLIWQGHLPDEAWREMAYLAGSWIGGGANALALHDVFGSTPAPAASVIVVDVAVANAWMGVLLYFAGRHERVDRWLGGDTSAINDLEERMHDYQARVERHATTTDLMFIVSLAFGGAWLAALGAEICFRHQPSFLATTLGESAWKAMLATAFGVLLSFTRVRSLEGAGASKLGGVMIYLLVASIGATADFSKLGDAGAVLGMGATWIIIHIAVLITVGFLIKAPFFFVAVGSQANIGGAASAPVVAGAFNPVLAPVGVLLAIAGYVLGTSAGLLCITLCKFVAGDG